MLYSITSWLRWRCEGQAREVVKSSAINTAPPPPSSPTAATTTAAAAMAAEGALKKLDGMELPAAADMHVHLREGDMTELVVYVPNSLLSSSLTTTSTTTTTLL